MDQWQTDYLIRDYIACRCRLASKIESATDKLQQQEKLIADLLFERLNKHTIKIDNKLRSMLVHCAFEFELFYEAKFGSLLKEIQNNDDDTCYTSLLIKVFNIQFNNNSDRIKNWSQIVSFISLTGLLAAGMFLNNESVDELSQNALKCLSSNRNILKWFELNAGWVINT